MFRKIAITVTVLIFLGVGFFGIILEKQLDDNQVNINKTEAESYCLFKERELEMRNGVSYCVFKNNSEPTQDFFGRLGE